MLIDTTYADIKAAEERLILFEQSLLREAEDMLQAAIGQFRYGKTDSLHVFDIYRIYKETRLEHLKTLLNFHLSLAELEAVGEEE
jgi:outer membrane protein TolC